MTFESDPGLLERFRAGEEAALERVYYAYVDQVTRFARAVVRSRAGGARDGHGLVADLGDLVQEVFAKAFTRDARCRYDGQRPYGPYLMTIARNVAVDQWRVSARFRAVDVSALAEALPPQAASSHYQSWEDPETEAVIDRYLAALDPELRRVHDALYVRGLSQRGAAALFGVGRQVIRTLERKLRSGLARALRKAGRPASSEATRSRRGAVRSVIV